MVILTRPRIRNTMIASLAQIILSTVALGALTSKAAPPSPRSQVTCTLGSTGHLVWYDAANNTHRGYIAVSTTDGTPFLNFCVPILAHFPILQMACQLRSLSQTRMSLPRPSTLRIVTERI